MSPAYPFSTENLKKTIIHNVLAELGALRSEAGKVAPGSHPSETSTSRREPPV